VLTRAEQVVLIAVAVALTATVGFWMLVLGDPALAFVALPMIAGAPVIVGMALSGGSPFALGVAGSFWAVVVMSGSVASRLLLA
jgi:hypothetical protein